MLWRNGGLGFPVFEWNSFAIDHPGHSGQIFCQTLAKSKSCIYRYIVLLKLGFITALPTTYYRFEAKPWNI